MASPHRLTTFVLALSGAVAAHALLLTLPLHESAPVTDSRETLQIHLAARAGSNTASPRQQPQTLKKAPPATKPIKAIRNEAMATVSPKEKHEHPALQHQSPPEVAPRPLISTRSPLAETTSVRNNAPDSKPEKPAAPPAPAPSPSPQASVPHLATAGSLQAPEVNADTTLSPAVQRQMNDAFRARLSAYLAHFRHYPLLARREGQTGIVKLHFVMDRQGRVLSRRLTQSTPYPLLNREALSLLDRASPLPHPPTSLAGHALSYTLPITFEIH